MEIRHLRAFIATYEERSLTSAANRLNATQPGLSVQIATLEADLGSKLFDRHARGLIPTVAGHRFYPLAVAIIHDMNAAVGTIRSLSEAMTGSISIGLPPTLSKAILAVVLTEFAHRYPDVKIRVVEGFSTALLPLLANGDVDCCLAMAVSDHPEIRMTPIYRDRFVIVSGDQLDLPAGQVIALNGDKKLKLVIPTLRYGLHQLLEPLLRTERIMPERLIEIDGLSGTLKFLKESDWAALLPFAAVHDEIDDSGIRVNAIAGGEIGIEYYIAQLATEHLQPAAQVFIDMAAKALDDITKRWPAAKLF